MREISNIQKQDNCVGKGEVESSILSGSTTEFINETKEISQSEWEWFMAYRQMLERKYGRRKNKEGTC